MKIILFFFALLIGVSLADPLQQCIADSLQCVEECQTLDQNCLDCIINELPECCMALFPNWTICNDTMTYRNSVRTFKSVDCQGSYAEISCERCVNGPCVDPVSVHCPSDIVGCGDSSICCPVGKQASCICNGLTFGGGPVCTCV